MSANDILSMAVLIILCLFYLALCRAEGRQSGP